MVSLVIPVYNSQKYLEECIRSILTQTYSDWEALFINEFGSDDGSREIILNYSKKDKRIKLIQNNSKLGLAQSLNKGFQIAKGSYIARLDADDIAYPTRLERQVEFMEQNPNIGVCGTYQKHFGKGVDWIHKPPTTIENCRANLLFGCDICHSTLMIRKEIFLSHNLFYDNKFLAEDFELWSRAVAITDFINIPEVLGGYRLGEDNITNAKKERLNIESGDIVANSLKRNLQMEISPKEKYYFQGWENPFELLEEKKRKKELKKFEHLLKEIIIQNKKVKFYEETALLNAIASKWNWACYQKEWNQFYDVHSVEDIFVKEKGIGWKYKIKQRIKKMVKFFVRPFWSRLDARIYLAECNIQSNLNQKSDELQKQIKVLETNNQLLKDVECNIQSNLNQKSDELQKQVKALEINNQLLKNEVYIIKRQLEKNKKKN